MRALFLCLLLAVCSYSHELWITGVTIDAGDERIAVTARVHALNLRSDDPAKEIQQRIRIRVDGQPWRAEVVNVRTDPGTDVLVWTAHGRGSGSTFTLDGPVFPDLPADRTIVNLVREGHAAGGAILDSGARHVRIGETRWELVIRFVKEGVHHILEGIDHIAFLIAILLPVRRLRDLVKVITAFTIAHSITLTLAATGHATLSPHIVEPAIAMSIALAALENLYGSGSGTRVRTAYAFGFGLIHGFGFAGSLAESGLPMYALWPAVLAFNFGVEIGQLAIVALLAPVAAFAEARNPALRPLVIRYASLAMIVLGVTWSVQRLIA